MYKNAPKHLKTITEYVVNPDFSKNKKKLFLHRDLPIIFEPHNLEDLHYNQSYLIKTIKKIDIECYQKIVMELGYYFFKKYSKKIHWEYLYNALFYFKNAHEVGTEKNFFYFKSLFGRSYLLHKTLYFINSSVTVEDMYKTNLRFVEELELKYPDIIEPKLKEDDSNRKELQIMYLTASCNILGTSTLPDSYDFEQALIAAKKIYKFEEKNPLDTMPSHHQVLEIFYKKLLKPYIIYTENPINNKCDHSLFRTIYESFSKINEIILKIISEVSINVLHQNQYDLTHYTSFDTFFKLLQGNEIRLGHILNANDPDENKTIKKLFDIDDKFSENCYVLCFSLNPDDLNQYRLYGNKHDKECITNNTANGLSIVLDWKLIKNKFFCNKSNESFISEEDISFSKSFKLPLYRIIYIATKEHHHENFNEKNFKVFLPTKDIYTFYDENRDNDEYDQDLIETHKKANRIQKYILDLSVLIQKIEQLKTTEKFERDGLLSSINIDGIVTFFISLISPIIKKASFKNENEFRIFLNTDRVEIIKESDGKKFIPFKEIPKYIKEIILGCNFSDENEETLRNICVEKGFNFPIKRSQHSFRDIRKSIEQTCQNVSHDQEKVVP